MTGPHRAALVALLLIGCSGRRSFEEPLVLGGREISADALNRGEFAYMRYCKGCHGMHGRGDGPYASSMTPRPADLTTGRYPHLGEGLPSDVALRQLVRSGIEGSMPPQPLSDRELAEAVDYLKTLAPVWRQEVQ